MKYKLAILIATLWTSIAYAQIYGFKTFSNEFEPSSEPKQTIITNMPPARSQDGLGICYTFAASSIIEHAICKEKKLDCTSLNSDQRPSVITLARYAMDSSSLSDRSDPNEYPKKIRDNFTFGVDVLQNIFFTKSFTKESCIPFDSVVSLTNDPSSQNAAQLAMWKSFEKSYKEYQNKKSCSECALDYATTTANQLITEYKLKTSNVEILKAFSSNTYEEFLYRTLVPESCSRPDKQIDFYTGNKKLSAWPIESDKKPNYSDAIEKIKANLKRDIPVMVNRFCTLEKPTPECSRHTTNGIEMGGHSFVITGYRKMCKKNDKNNCYDAVRVLNSWGQQWQDQTNDGWVDAKTLIDRTQYEYASFAWIESK